MTTTITLPESLVTQLQRRAAVEQQSIESLALAYIMAGLTAVPAPVPEVLEPDRELLELIVQIKAMRRNPANGIPAPDDLEAVIKALVAIILDDEYNFEEEMAALDAAEAELRAEERAVAHHEGRG